MLSKQVLPLLALAGSAVAQLPSITMKGSKFFYPNGTQFFMKGVAYQQDTAASDGNGGSTFDKTEDFKDPLANKDRCQKDIPRLVELGTNTIRTYAIDPTEDHTFCMNMLQDAGIYVVSDLGQPNLSINRDDPNWNVELFDRYKAVVDEMGKYSNVIGFFAGNEVSNNNTNTQASAYVKAAVRDTKKYIADNMANNNGRWMGVGYAANDDPDIRIDIAHYFNCGPEEEAIDFWGYNIYSWCGQSTLQRSGYNDQADFFRNYSVPVFFAEYGCNNEGAENRLFQETGALYEDTMTEVFSGGIVYMYFQEANDYGLVELSNSGSPDRLQPAFDNLAQHHADADPKGVSEDSYNPTNQPAECPEISEVWKVDPQLPPTPDSSLCDCAVAASSCVRASNLDVKEFADMFGTICGDFPEICAGINGNATTGVYGAYSMCNAAEKLDYVLGQYVEARNGASDACDFGGNAQTQSAKEDSSCSDKLAAASSVNEQAATATAPIDNPNATGSGDSGSGDDSAALPGAAMLRVFALGDLAVGLYMVVALGAGAAMIAL
jgi:hypothetical protein